MRQASWASLLLGLLLLGVSPSFAAGFRVLLGTPAPDGSAEYRIPLQASLHWTIQSREGRAMSGQGQVGPDGSLEIGPYGQVPVAGLSLAQAEQAAVRHLQKFLAQPRVAIRQLAAAASPAAAAVRPVSWRPIASSETSSREPSASAGAWRPLAAAPERPELESGWREFPEEARAPGEVVVSADWQVPEALVVQSDAPVTEGPELQPMPEGAPEEISTPEPVHAPRQVRREESAMPAAPAGPTPPCAAAPAGAVHHGLPHEFNKLPLAPYVIEPPDVLLVESTQQLRDQPVRGQHLVRPDGTISLGIYGTAFVGGMTLEQAKVAIAAVLATRIKDFDARNLSVDVLAYNSKFYYVITDGGGYGEQVIRFPITGSETVLDAIGQINGLPPVASKKHIWVARAQAGGQQVLPVDWVGITTRGTIQTNYQLLPGDRVYVQAQKIITFDSRLARIISPIERVLGVTLLGSATVNSIKGRGFGSGNNNN